MKIQTKIPKLQMHKDVTESHFYVIYPEFLCWAIKVHVSNMLQLYTANFLYIVFNPYKKAFQFYFSKF